METGAASRRRRPDGLAAGRAVPEPLEYLAGAWELDRVVADELAGVEGRFVGSATFERVGATSLVYREAGELELPGYRGRATRSYRYVADEGRRVRVEFEDGRDFHDAELLVEGFATVHLCGGDRYEGRYALVSDRCWTLEWRVTGPATSLRLLSRFDRAR
ncbi:MAG: DUF6314 family protein [Actinomycetota bacterium]|nr:DUF6314 family protein [Actinomycetota bacterium]